MRILGIETSCDETAAAIVTRAPDGTPLLLGHTVLSQVEDHAAFGGVVPELAARAHLSALDHVIARSLTSAGLTVDDIDAVAATAGPGLIGGLLVGMTTAKAIAAATAKPFLAINHLEGHALTARLTDHLDYPYLLLLVSGGHTQILAVKGLGHYQRLATTIDDALGEAFDKTAKLLGLPFPGGPAVEHAAMKGDPDRFDLPRPLQGRDTLDVSFSGLKTAIRTRVRALEPLSETDIADLCASFQATVCTVLADRVARTIGQASRKDWPQSGRVLVAAGGVAANQAIRRALEEVCAKAGWRFLAPPLELCGDNAAMIAWAGLERFEKGYSDSLDVAPRPRWPLDETAAAKIGSGKRGAKA